MDINVDLNDVITELLEQNKALLLENIILKKALDRAGQALEPAQISYVDPSEKASGEIDI